MKHALCFLLLTISPMHTQPLPGCGSSADSVWTRVFGTSRYPGSDIVCIVYKRQMIFEVHACGPEGELRRVARFPVCAIPDGLGPKRRAGDNMTPEGIYNIDALNPRSAYHLSMHVDYPNASDRLLGERGNLGGDIYVHGKCCTIGCIAMGDETIEQLYRLAERAMKRGQRKIPLYIFPDSDYRQTLLLAQAVRGQSERSDGKQAPSRGGTCMSSLAAFWEALAEIQEELIERKRIPAVVLDSRKLFVPKHRLSAKPPGDPPVE